MISWVIKKLAKITILGKIFEKLGPKFPTILLFLFLIFIAFYGPYEYENYLEFNKNYPGNNVGLILNLLRPFVIILIFLFFILSAFGAERERKKRIANEVEELRQREAEFNVKKEAALKRLDDLKNSSVGKITSTVATKESIGALGGGTIGAALGGSLGVAGKIVGIGVALNGGIVLAGIGAVIGYLGVKAFKKNKNTKDVNQKIKEYDELDK
ncbi:hypothetical protein [Candidatus Pelagibacter sp. Uisw_106]|jgi:hypothetical protein|uniref:hypothetical protein n=1 Tax=Candidatus Pelagibacter sp. Uisw_106 TaxID=3230984 RepID=UPI0039EA817C|tara:strand:+ start:540 stop:1178 length:639 start_codon:yes stop_codon:yes gene_type:complete